MAAARIAGFVIYPANGWDNVGGTFVQVFMSWIGIGIGAATFGSVIRTKLGTTARRSTIVRANTRFALR